MEEETRTTQELIVKAYEAYQEEKEDDDDDESQYWHIIGELHKRGSSCEFEAAQTLTNSTNPIEREMGADILGQLGWSKDCFHAESVAILIKLLNDEADDVIGSAAFSLGHRSDPLGIPHLIPLVDHKNTRVRWGVTLGLSCLNDELAVNGLIKLSKDTDYDVKNWATFGLGSLCEIDTVELRLALFERLSDESPEIRGEALVGLARRLDENIKEAIKKELSGEFNGIWAVNAAELIADPEFCPLLHDLRQRIIDDDEPERFVEDADEAIMACCNKL